MKKYLLFAISLLLLGGVNAQQPRLTSIRSNAFVKDITKEESATSMNIGYCGDLAFNWQLGANVNMKSMTEFPAELMKKYVGNSLTKIKVGIGADTGIKNAKIILSYGLDMEPFYTQDITFKAGQWNEITLNTPYQIEEKTIYVGYSLTSGPTETAAPLSTDEELGSGHDYLALPGKDGSLSWYKALDLIPYNLGIKAVVEGNSLPQFELRFDNLIPQKGLLSKEEKATLKGSVTSLGAQTIKNLDIVYQIEDAEPVVVKVEDLNINSTDRYSFTIKDIAINPDTYTKYKVTINNFNGLGDAVPGSDTLTTNVLCPGERSVARKVLLENFTTAKCPNCPAGHTTLKSVVGNNQNIIWVSHHSGFYADDYTISESETYTWFYNNKGGTYAPAMMLDRSDFRSSGAKPNGGNSPVFGVDKTTAQNTLKASLETPAYATVVLGKTYDSNTRKLDLTISGNALYGNLPGTTRMNVYLTESGIVGPQSGGNNKYVHDHVIRKVLSTVWGDAISFDAEGNYSVTYSYTLDSEWIPSNMDVVAYLSNYDPKDVMNCPVFNSETVRVDPQGSSIGSSEADGSALVYSNDSQIAIDGEFTSATIFDTTGKVVEVLGAQKVSSKVASGVYFVKITSNEQTIIKKIAVK